jgi:hypothetical protein
MPELSPPSNVGFGGEVPDDEIAWAGDGVTHRGTQESQDDVILAQVGGCLGKVLAEPPGQGSRGGASERLAQVGRFSHLEKLAECPCQVAL